MAWTPTTIDVDELIRQFLDVKRATDDLRERVKRLEDEVIYLADQRYDGP